MDHDFWVTRWNQGQIGFHLPDINPALIRHLPAFGIPKGANVLVPLCGKSLDLLYLRAEGLSVTGLELSPIAVEAFWRENNLMPALLETEALRIWSTDGLTLIEGDFFKVNAKSIATPDLVYDRAALIAMPPEMRSAYAAHLLSLAGGAAILLITLEYPEKEMQGPPFPIPHDEILHHFGPTHQVDVLGSEDMLEENLSLKDKGLTALRETVYRLTPK